MTQDIDQLAINTIRTLSIDAVEKANSGHPGTPMALAPVAYELWQNHLRYDPADPIWPNRDRFVLSAGHASMLLYSMLFLTGVKKVDADYNVTDEPACSLHEIEEFRQLHSRTPGHPEYRWTTGVETTTGPLGQGIATSVGMALASKWQGERFGADLFDFDVYAIAGDGCLMEGVSHEAASLAGHLKLDNLCWLYDNNHITIDGATDLAYDDDVLSRFEGYGWNVLRVGDANDASLLARALERVQGRDRPPDPDRRRQPHRLGLAEQAGHRVRPRRTARRGGGEADQEGLRLARGRPVPRPRRRPRALRRGDRRARRRAQAPPGSRSSTAPTAQAEIEMMQHRQLPDGWDGAIPSFEADEEKGLATRKASNKVQNAIAERVPWMISGSADLTDSTSVRLNFDGAVNFEPGSFNGRQIHFGIREHAAADGLQRARRSQDQAALVDLPHLLRLRPPRDPPLGADGAAGDPPLHPRLDRARRGRPDPPADRAAGLAAGDAHLDVIRPADANETAEAWRLAIDRTHNPVALVLTRQTVPIFDRSKLRLRRRGPERRLRARRRRGGDPELILIATGSEVQLALGAHETLTGEGIRSRVVSLPCWELFDRQDAGLPRQVLPPA